MEQTRNLVFQLGVKLNALDDIDDRYDGDNRKQHYVQKWLDIDTDANWETLTNGLRQINMNSLAAEIEGAHLDKQTQEGDVLFCSNPTAVVSTTLLSAGATTPVQLDATVADPCFLHRVEEAMARIEFFEDEFADLIVEAKLVLSKRENEDESFFIRFHTYIRVLPVSKKNVHMKFFSKKEKEIKMAKNVDDLFEVLIPYCNYSNYEIILHIIKKFCPILRLRMLKYRDSLIGFEKNTTVDVYLSAIAAHPHGPVYDGFIRMTMKINKPPSKCTLYEIRSLKELIAEEAAVESYAMYIDTPGEGSVLVELWVHEDVLWIVSEFLTKKFAEVHLLTDLAVDGEEIYMVRKVVVEHNLQANGVSLASAVLDNFSTALKTFVLLYTGLTTV